MTYDHELTLIGEGGGLTKDREGNQSAAETRTVILCGVKSVGRNEFYSAAAASLRPELVFVMHSFEYNGEKKVEYLGDEYSVIRTYGIGTEEIELTCKAVA